jgi:prevent-host-death family protein
MARVWQLQAKNKLSEVIEEAITHGPQIITNMALKP